MPFGASFVNCVIIQSFAAQRTARQRTQGNGLFNRSQRQRISSGVGCQQAQTCILNNTQAPVASTDYLYKVHCGDSPAVSFWAASIGRLSIFLVADFRNGTANSRAGQICKPCIPHGLSSYWPDLMSARIPSWQTSRMPV